MNQHSHPAAAAPVSARQRHVVLDALRGFALLGVCLANYPEFSLFSFLSAEEQSAMPTSALDTAVRWLQVIFVEGKFYTLFSLLFGIGFSIIISHARERGANGMRIFYRRMIVLMLIGLAHLLLVWSGDILMLYAALGMLLPLCYGLSDRALLRTAVAMLLLPIAVDAVAAAAGVRMGGALLDLQWARCAQVGITEENFASWLRDARSYADVSAFLQQGAFERMWEFVEGNRYFKVFGLFLLGLYIGRNRIYADLDRHAPLLRRTARWGLAVGLPLSIVFAWSYMNGRPLGTAFHTAIYTASVYPMGLAYAALLALSFRRRPALRLWTLLAAPGRMAMTCYLCQSFIGMLLFYGIGFGMGTHVGFAATELVALLVYAVEAICCLGWLGAFSFGPFEWIWRMLTYGRWLPIRKSPRS